MAILEIVRRSTRRPASALLFGACLLAIAFACRPGPRPTGAFPQFVTSSLEGFEDGSFRRGRLKKHSKIDGLLCRDWVRRHPNGNLEYVRLAQPDTIAGHAVPAKTAVFFDAQGRPRILALSADTPIDGHRCRGGVKIHSGLYPSGRLRSYFAREDVVVDGIPCKASLFHGIHLHENGRLAACTLAAPMVIRGESYPPQTDLRFTPSGDLESAE